MTQENNVLQPNYQPSTNFYTSDKMLQNWLRRFASPAGQAFMHNHWLQLGAKAANQMNPLSMRADKQGPQLVKRDALGRNIDHIEFHPDYWRLTQIAIDSQMFAVKWQPQLRSQFAPERNTLSFGAGYLFAMSESGLYCPLCMTDGVALLLDRHATPTDRDRLMPHIYTQNLEDFYTGAMFLTEKAGGSDVGANLVTATPNPDGSYSLNGEKWFCSNANAQIIFALARTDINKKGTAGLGIFLVERQLPDGQPNPIELVRLKDKLGVRSMASGEYIFHNTRATLVGQPTEGFKIMTDMINLSRLYNSMAAYSAMRRALVEAYQFLQARQTFGKNAMQHALVRTKLWELGAIGVANFYLTWRAISALDAAENGNTDEQQLLRLLTPMVKKCTAQDAVYSVRESMELMGGMGYIEDGVMPKIMRDVMVLPIWEGAGNIMLLDMLRAALKSQGLSLILAEIASILNQAASELLPDFEALKSDIQRALAQPDPDIMQVASKDVFERLTRWYQFALMLKYTDKESQHWLRPAVEYWAAHHLGRSNAAWTLPSIEQIADLLAWQH